MSTDRIDISPEIDALCEKLGLGPKQNVRRLDIDHANVEATVYLTRRVNGRESKYVDDETGRAACETRVIAVTT